MALPLNGARKLICGRFRELYTKRYKGTTSKQNGPNGCPTIVNSKSNQHDKNRSPQEAKRNPPLPRHLSLALPCWAVGHPRVNEILPPLLATASSLHFSLLSSPSLFLSHLGCPKGAPKVLSLPRSTRRSHLRRISCSPAGLILPTSPFTPIDSARIYL